MRRYVIVAGLAASEILALQMFVIVSAHIVFRPSDPVLFTFGSDLLLLAGLGTWLWWRKDLVSAASVLVYAAVCQYGVVLSSTIVPLSTYLLLFVGAFVAHAQDKYTKSDFGRLAHGLGRAYVAVSAVVALIVLGAMVWHSVAGGVKWALSLDTTRYELAAIGLWPIFTWALLLRHGPDSRTLLTLVGLVAVAWTALGWWVFISICWRWRRPDARLSVSDAIDR
jgi:hypothetical protein